MEMRFAKGFELVCDNDRCHLFRQPQGCRLAESKEVIEAKGYQRRHDLGNPARKVFSSGPMLGGSSQSLGCSLVMPSHLVQVYFGWDPRGINE